MQIENTHTIIMTVSLVEARAIHFALGELTSDDYKSGGSSGANSERMEEAGNRAYAVLNTCLEELDE